jgi:hypothetical protein
MFSTPRCTTALIVRVAPSTVPLEVRMMTPLVSEVALPASLSAHVAQPDPAAVRRLSPVLMSFRMLTANVPYADESPGSVVPLVAAGY